MGNAADAHRYRELLDKAPIGFYEIVDGKITYINEFLEQLSGYSLAEISGRPVEELIAGEDREFLHERLTRPAAGVQATTPTVYRFLAKDGSVYVGEARSRRIVSADGVKIEGTIRDISQETRLSRFTRVVLTLGETILAEQDIDRILQLVLDSITEHSGFRRAVLSLYDLSIPVPADGDVRKMLCSGLSLEEEKALRNQDPLSPEQRRQAFDEKYRLGPAYYIPYNQTPWPTDWGLAGTVEVDGWNLNDFLFIPLRGSAGIIGTISVDDPVDVSAPTTASIEPVASLANLAALAVERVYKLNQLSKQKDRLSGLSGFGAELSGMTEVDSLCQHAARRARDDMDYDYCAVWIVDGEQIVKQGLATKPLFEPSQVDPRGSRHPSKGTGLTRYALEHLEPLIVPDVLVDPRVEKVGRPIRSQVNVPILGRKGALGVIEVQSQRLAAFGEEDLEILSALAGQMSVAISALQRRDALGRIYALGQRLAASRSVDQVVASTLDFLVEQFDYELSELFLDDGRGALAVADVRGPSVGDNMDQGWTLPAGRGVISWAARNRRSALVEDVATDPRYHKSHESTRSELAVPIQTSERVLGVLNVESRIPAFFDAEDRQLIEAVANHLAVALSNLEAQEHLREQAVRDPLTDLFNRHYFNSIILPELDRSDRYHHPLTLMMVDIDGFRAINNRFGHLKGDEVLREVAIFLIENVRSSDRVIRYGGDEFLIFMPETYQEAPRVAERLRSRIPTVPRRTGIHGVAIGLSIGIYTRMPNDERSLESILEEVDRRMYANKRKRYAERIDELPS